MGYEWDSEKNEANREKHGIGLDEARYTHHELVFGFRFSEPDFNRNFDLSQSQNPRLSNTKALVLFNRKIKISGEFLP